MMKSEVDPERLGLSFGLSGNNVPTIKKKQVWQYDTGVLTTSVVFYILHCVPSNESKYNIAQYLRGKM